MILSIAFALTAFGPGFSVDGDEPNWRIAKPIVMEGDSAVRLSNPSVAWDGKQWHVFADGASGMSQLVFRQPDAADVQRLRPNLRGVFVPQVFFFKPENRWQFIGQSKDTTGRYPKSRPMLSTNPDVNDPNGWTEPVPLELPPPQMNPPEAWMDFCVICDDAKAHCFATSNDGRLWRSETLLSAYPKGWTEPEIALQDEGIAWASHTYRIGNHYATIVAARGPMSDDGKPGEQYQRTYTAEKLEGPWIAEQATWQEPFAGRKNIRYDDANWAADIVHCEPLLTGIDQRLILQENVPAYLIHGRYRSSTNDSRANGVATLGLLHPIQSTKPLLQADDISRTEVFHDDFQRTELGSSWKTNEKFTKIDGQATILNGALWLRQDADSFQAASAKHEARFQNGVVKVRFQLTDPSGLAVNFYDSALKTVFVGHIFSLRISSQQIIAEDQKFGAMDLQNRPALQVKNREIEMLVQSLKKSAAIELPTDVWHDLVVNIVDDHLFVTIDEKTVLEHRSKAYAHATKSHVGFHAGKGGVLIDSITVESVIKTEKDK